MKLLIEITEEDYKALDNYISFTDNSDGRILQAVKNGEKLPEIDTNDILEMPLMPNIFNPKILNEVLKNLENKENT